MPGLVANFHLIRKEKFSSEAWLLRSADPIDKHDVATISSSILVWIFLLKLYVACVITFGSSLSFFFFTEKSISKKTSWHGVGPSYSILARSDKILQGTVANWYFVFINGALLYYKVETIKFIREVDRDHDRDRDRFHLSLR